MKICAAFVTGFSSLSAFFSPFAIHTLFVKLGELGGVQAGSQVHPSPAWQTPASVPTGLCPRRSLPMHPTSDPHHSPGPPRRVSAQPASTTALPAPPPATLEQPFAAWLNALGSF